MDNLPAREDGSVEPVPDQPGSEEGLADKLGDIRLGDVELGDITPGYYYRGALRRSLRVARKGNKKYVGPGELLLEFLRQPDNLAAHILSTLNVNEESLKAIIKNDLLHRTADDATQDQSEYSLMQVGYDGEDSKPTDLFWRIFKEAQEYASKLHDEIVGPEHILYTLSAMEDRGAIPHDILRQLGVSHDDVEKKLFPLIGIQKYPLHVYLFNLIQPDGKVKDVCVAAENFPSAVGEVKKKYSNPILPYDPKLSPEELELAMKKPYECEVSPVDKIAGRKIIRVDMDTIVLQTSDNPVTRFG